MSSRGKYAGYQALDPFFRIILEGLSGLVDGEHFFDTFAEDAHFEQKGRALEGLLDSLAAWLALKRAP
jgi:hypothetical protein